MKTRCYLSIIIVFVLNISNIYSQSTLLPGGVSKPLVWLKAENIDSKYIWETNYKNENIKITNKASKGHWFNFNPSIVYNSKKDSIIIPLGTDNKIRQTVFIAYKVNDSLKEQILWTITNSKKITSIATNKRLADLKNYFYHEYSSKVKPYKANIHYFQQNVTDSTANNNYLTIGKKNILEPLPPVDFDGEISEIILYDRVLSGTETQKILSYLAIKYGISISEFDTFNYLDSKGNILWNYADNKKYSTAITAVGRDNTSGLLQIKSTNMLQEGLITMELNGNKTNIPDNFFAFWSDNGKNLSLGKQEQGEPIGFAREWLLKYKETTDVNLDWVLNPNFLKGKLPKDTYYWLLVDYSGMGTFQINNSEYINIGATDDNKDLTLKNFEWDKFKTAKVNFKVKIAPKMFGRVGITEATCGIINSGDLNYTIEGGEAPYTITIKNEETGNVINQWTQAAKSNHIVRLNSGKYFYTIRDNQGNLYSDLIFVSDKNGTYADLKEKYTLTNENPLYLDAKTNLPVGNYQFEWFYEGNFIDNNSQILINQPGDYELRIVNNQNCKTTQKFNVISDGNSAIIDNTLLMLYPNPTIDGNFSLAINYPSKTDLKISVFSTTGALIREKNYKQIETLIHHDKIVGAKGIYLIRVQSDWGTKHFKLIVN